MTLALCSAGSSKSVLTDNGNGTDFHRDANPTEVAKATRPLDMLISRVSQLLSAFPGHSVLIALVQVADHVRKLPLSTTSVGKAMHGLEIILQKAQAWEQHASSHVKLGTSLQNVSELVACWRKLELQSWGTLLEARSMRFAKRARRHWPRLYNVLVKGTDHKHGASTLNHCSVEAPNWVWKGLRTGMGAFISSSAQFEVDGAMIDHSRVMDTFLLSSSLGEFHERLKLVETFAFQMTLMSEHSGHRFTVKYSKNAILPRILLQAVRSSAGNEVDGAPSSNRGSTERRSKACQMGRAVLLCSSRFD